jgi:glycosyltransferase involved in cell wall biosynthesis
VKPVLFVTGHAPPERVGALARLHAREGLEVALFGGRSLHGPGGTEKTPTDAEATRMKLPFPHRYIAHQHEAGRLAASGKYRAVVCSTGGRVALPATWTGARRAGTPVILWASLWAHPRSIPHAFSYLALRRLYRSADAIVTYGSHVSDYVRARGARNVHIAPQSVDNAFWSTPPTARPRDPAWPEQGVKFMFAGRPDRAKGVGALITAWQRSGLQAPSAALVLVGVGSDAPLRVLAGGAVSCIAPVSPARLREMYADADVLVVPSIRTRTFREPWGLVINEAMNQSVATIASDAVGAVAGGLVRDGHNGLVVPAGDSDALARAMSRLTADADLRRRLGAAGAHDVSAYTHDAWAAGFSSALSSIGLSRAG